MKARLGPPRGGEGRLRYFITAAGLMYTAAIALIGLAAMNANVNVLFVVFGLCIGLLVVSMLATRRVLRNLRVTREVPAAVIAGRPFVVRYRLTNAGSRRTIHAVRIEESVVLGGRKLYILGFVDHVRAQQTVTLDVEATASARGTLEFSRIRASTRFPFGLLGQSLTVPAHHTMVVFPRLLPIRRRLHDTRRAAVAHSLTTRHRRSGADEFYGLREYRAGDNLRWIHWRRSARLSKLLVREMVDVTPETVIIVLDTYLPAAAPPSARETAISAAATLLTRALEDGLKVGLMVLADSPVVIPPTSGRDLRFRLLRQLANIDEPASSPPAAVLAAQKWPGHWRGRCLLLATVSHQGVWQAANVLKSRTRELEVIATNEPEFAMWFGSITDNGGEPPTRRWRRQEAPV
jgi:uncharacterized protein (DUF58 family)